MSWPAWLFRIVPYLGRLRAGEDLEQEMRLHVELERDRLVDIGVAPDAAARAAQHRVGWRENVFVAEPAPRPRQQGRRAVEPQRFRLRGTAPAVRRAAVPAEFTGPPRPSDPTRKVL